MGGRGGGGGGGGGAGGAAARAAEGKSMAKMYRQGKSLSQIAKATGKSASTVHKRLTSAGVNLRPRGSAPRRG